MIDPKNILATKVTNAGAMVLIKLPDGKTKWVWRDERDRPKPATDNWNEFLSR